MPFAWQNKMFSITSTLNSNSSASSNKNISFGVSTAIWEEPDSFSSWRCHYVDNSSIVLKRYNICMRGSIEGVGNKEFIYFFYSHCKITKNIPRTTSEGAPDELNYSSNTHDRFVYVYLLSVYIYKDNFKKNMTTAL